jgi:nucleoporin SEH1
MVRLLPALLTRNVRPTNIGTIMTSNNQAGRSARPDPFLDQLDAVSQHLATPGFLRRLTASQLPSAAVSESSSLSPTREEARLRPPPSNLNLAVTFDDEIEHVDLIAPLIQEPCADGSPGSVEQQVIHHLETAFVAARRAYQTMAAERSFQTFSHGHQDLVLAVDFNYFGTRMVTASSDHRLKVWDKKDDSWALVESWKAHDAEIVDVSDLIVSRKPHFACLHVICHLCALSLIQC